MDKWIWLDIEAQRTRPYEVARCLYNVYELFEILVELREVGYKIGIISWSSKAHDKTFDKRVANVKNEWLYMHCLDIVIDKVLVTAHGIKKADTCRPYGYGVLVDDEEKNRKDWDLGITIDATKNILEELRALL